MAAALMVALGMLGGVVTSAGVQSDDSDPGIIGIMNDDKDPGTIGIF